MNKNAKTNRNDKYTYEQARKLYWGAHKYKTIRNLVRALEDCPEETIRYCNENQYDEIRKDSCEYKFLQFFNVKLRCHKEVWSGHGARATLWGWRVTIKVGGILNANKQLIEDVAKYI